MSLKSQSANAPYLLVSGPVPGSGKPKRTRPNPHLWGMPLPRERQTIKGPVQDTAAGLGSGVKGGLARSAVRGTIGDGGVRWGNHHALVSNETLSLTVAATWPPRGL